MCTGCIASIKSCIRDEEGREMQSAGKKNRYSREDKTKRNARENEVSVEMLDRQTDRPSLIAVGPCPRERQRACVMCYEKL